MFNYFEILFIANILVKISVQRKMIEKYITVPPQKEIHKKITKNYTLGNHCIVWIFSSEMSVHWYDSFMKVYYLWVSRETCSEKRVIIQVLRKIIKRWQNRVFGLSFLLCKTCNNLLCFLRVYVRTFSWVHLSKINFLVKGLLRFNSAGS